MIDYGRNPDLGEPDERDTNREISEGTLEKLEEIYLVQKTHEKEIIVVKSLAAAGDYAAEDVLSESASVGTPFIFRGAAREHDGGGLITKAIAFCSVTALTPRITLYLFSREPTSNLNDNAANAAPNAADFPFFQGQIDFTALEDLGGGSSSVITPNTSGNLPLPYDCEDGNLYGIAVLRDAVTGESAGMLLSFKLKMEQD